MPWPRSKNCKDKAIYFCTNRISRNCHYFSCSFLIIKMVGLLNKKKVNFNVIYYLLLIIIIISKSNNNNNNFHSSMTTTLLYFIFFLSIMWKDGNMVFMSCFVHLYELCFFFFFHLSYISWQYCFCCI